MSSIKRVMPMEDYRLFVEMETGSTAVVEFKNKLETARFTALSDKPFFASAVTDGDYVIWSDQKHTLKISIKELLDVLRGFGLQLEE